MSTGIHIEGSDDIKLKSVDIIGFDKGIVIKNSTNVVAVDVSIVEKAILTYGPEFADVIEKVSEDPTAETAKALEDVMSNTVSAWTSWGILVDKYGKTIGRFSVNILSKVLTATAYEALKDYLHKHGVEI